MQKSSTSTGSTPPETPDTRPSFGRRLLAFLAYGSGRYQPSSPPFQPRSAEPTWLKESRASLAMQDGARVRSEEPAKDEARRALEAADPFLAGYTYTDTESGKPPLGPCLSFLDLAETARHFSGRYTRNMGESAARALAWRDNLVWRRRLLDLDALREKENAIYRANLDAEKRRAERFDIRADILNAAIQYVTEELSSYEALGWLSAWNEGEEHADNQLREWINGPGRELLGEAVARRIGLPPVPPPVGRERPGPAEVPAADAIERGGYHYTPHVPDAVPVHSAPINYAPGSFVLGGVKVGFGVTCLELGGQTSPVVCAFGHQFHPAPKWVSGPVEEKPEPPIASQMDEAERRAHEQFPHDPVMRNLRIQELREQFRLNTPVGPTVTLKEKKPEPPLSDAGCCTGFNRIGGDRFCSRDPARYRECDICPGKLG